MLLLIVYEGPSNGQETRIWTSIRNAQLVHAARSLHWSLGELARGILTVVYLRRARSQTDVARSAGQFAKVLVCVRRIPRY